MDLKAVQGLNVHTGYDTAILEYFVYLASASPRRQELLRQIDIRFDVMVADVNEQRQGTESPLDYVARLAGNKARDISERVKQRHLPAHPVLGADTCIVLDDEIMGKPHDETEGKAMLRRLSGRTHEVLTAIAVVHDDSVHRALSRSRVTFGELSDADIDHYWHSGEPADKAGAYAIQGKAAAFIARIEGSYSGIVGLPLYELIQILRRLGR